MTRTGHVEERHRWSWAAPGVRPGNVGATLRIDSTDHYLTARDLVALGCELQLAGNRLLAHAPRPGRHAGSDGDDLPPSSL